MTAMAWTPQLFASLVGGVLLGWLIITHLDL